MSSLSWEQLVNMTRTMIMDETNERMSLAQWSTFFASLLQQHQQPVNDTTNTEDMKLDSDSDIWKLLQLQYKLVRNDYQHTLEALNEMVLPLLFSSNVDVEFGKAVVCATFQTVPNDTVEEQLLQLSCQQLHSLTKESINVKVLELRCFIYLKLVERYPTHSETVWNAIHNDCIMPFISEAPQTATWWTKPMTSMILPVMYPPTPTSPTTSTGSKEERGRKLELWNMLQQLMSLSSSNKNDNTATDIIVTGIGCVVLPNWLQQNDLDIDWMTNCTLWNFLHHCLSTEEKMIRRRALYMLQTIIQHQQSSSNTNTIVGSWNIYVNCLDALEMEMEVHLMDQIFPILVELTSTLSWEWVQILYKCVLTHENPSIQKWALYRLVTGDAGISIITKQSISVVKEDNNDQHEPQQQQRKQQHKKQRGKKHKKKLEGAPLDTIPFDFVLEVIFPCYDSIDQAVGTGLQIPSSTTGKMQTTNVMPPFISFIVQYISLLSNKSKTELSTFVYTFLTSSLSTLRIRTSVFLLTKAILPAISTSTNDDTILLEWTPHQLQQIASSFQTNVISNNIVNHYRKKLLHSIAILLSHSTTTTLDPNLLLSLLALFPSPLNMNDDSMSTLLSQWLSNINDVNHWSTMASSCASSYVSGLLLIPTSSDDLEREIGSAIITFSQVCVTFKQNPAEWLWTAISKGLPPTNTSVLVQHWPEKQQVAARRATILLQYGCMEQLLNGMGHGDLVLTRDNIMMPPPSSIESILHCCMTYLFYQVQILLSESANTTKGISKSYTNLIAQVQCISKSYPSSGILPELSQKFLRVHLQNIIETTKSSTTSEEEKIQLVKNMSLCYAVLTCGANYVPEQDDSLPSLLEICRLLLHMNFIISRKSNTVSTDTMRAARSMFQYTKWGILSHLVPMESASTETEFYQEVVEEALESVEATPQDSLLPLFETVMGTTTAGTKAKIEMIMTLFSIMKDTTHSPTKMYMLHTICSVLFRTHYLRQECDHLIQEYGSSTDTSIIEKEDAPIYHAFCILTQMAGTFKPHILRYAVTYITAAWISDNTTAIMYRTDIAHLLLYKEAKLDEATTHQETLVQPQSPTTIVEQQEVVATNIPKETNKSSVIRAYMLVFLSKLPNHPSDTVLKDLCHYLIHWILDNVLLSTTLYEIDCNNNNAQGNKKSNKHNNNNKKKKKGNANTKKNNKSNTTMIMTGSEEYCQKIRAWQALCILSRFVTEDIASNVIEKTFQTLSYNMHGQIRSFSEVFLLQCARRHPIIFASQFQHEIQRRDISCQHISSLMVIAGNLLVGKKYSSDFLPHILHHNKKNLLQSTICGILPYLSSTQSFSRAIAQLLAHHLIPLIIDTTANQNKSNTNSVDFRNDWYLYSMWRFLDENQEMKRLRTKQVNFFDGWCDIDELCTPQGLMNIPVDEGDEANPTHMMEVIKRSLEEVYTEAHDNENTTTDAPMWKQLEQLMENMEVTSSSINKNDGDHTNEDDSDCGLVNFQRKIIPFDTLLLGMDGPQQDNRNAAGRNCQDLIVCASFIDKVPNLAGLARTAEIFAAQKLILPDLTVTKMDNFQSISVGAGEWVQMEECKEKVSQLRVPFSFCS